jgi:hypothetical protein
VELRATIGTIASLFVELIGQSDSKTHKAAASALVRLAEHGTLRSHATAI